MTNRMSLGEQLANDAINADVAREIREIDRAHKAELAETHRHVKTGGEYVVVGPGHIQSDTPLSDMDPVVIYRSANGRLWARRYDEFHDGRFEIIHKEGLPHAE